MAKYRYEDVVPTLIDNTTMKKLFIDDVHKTYNITPNTGYVLHDKGMDEILLDENGNETDEVLLGYRTSTASCAANYDFIANERKFCTVLENSVPADRIS